MRVYTVSLVPDINKRVKSSSELPSVMAPHFKCIKMCDEEKSAQALMNGWVTGLGWMEVR